MIRVPLPVFTGQEHIARAVEERALASVILSELAESLGRLRLLQAANSFALIP